MYAGIRPLRAADCISIPIIAINHRLIQAGDTSDGYRASSAIIRGVVTGRIYGIKRRMVYSSGITAGAGSIRIPVG